MKNRIIEQIFDQEIPVSKMENPDSNNFALEIEKMYDKFCNSLDEDLIGNWGHSLIKNISAEFDSEKYYSYGSLLLPKKWFFNC